MADLFRAKSIQRISDPEKLDDYIRVSNPRVWMLLVVIVLLIVGFGIWAVFGTIDDNGVAISPISLLFGGM